MMGLTPGPLKRALFLFLSMIPLVVLENPLVVLENPLVVSAARGLAGEFRQELSQLVTFFCYSCLYQEELSPKVVDS